jgi:hypothetical protein
MHPLLILVPNGQVGRRQTLAVRSRSISLNLSDPVLGDPTGLLNALL